MRIASVRALPFHDWILAGLDDALRLRGHEVVALTHRPSHRHDWLQSNAEGPVARRLWSERWDCVIAADHPYDLLSLWARAPSVAVRHSLAWRGNTWEPEVLKAHYVVTWSRHDEDLFPEGHDAQFLRGGCVWAEPCVRQQPAILASASPIVLWAPTWNPEWNYAHVVDAALQRLQTTTNCTVVVRRHAVADDATPPWDAIASADVVVTDVSGFGLLAACARGGRLPVVQVDPLVVSGSHAQYRPDGPEWTFRDAVGPRCRGGVGLAEAITTAIHVGVRDTMARDTMRRTLIGGDEWAANATSRTAAMIEAAISGTDVRSGTTD